jgi:asparagine synthase (glutamine-hydrolysing)
MCGLVALYAPTRGTDERLTILRGMARAIAHRGPDHQGEFEDLGTGLGLAHRRLSIVDLSPDGHQPMVSTSKRYVIVFNGEIYNFKSLRDDLRAMGVAFRGRSDTEVILAAVEAWGLNTTCQKIRGMFAIALYDRQDQTLHLIRDPFGKKPLYFGWADHDFVVASELKSICAHPGFSRRVSDASVRHYLHLGFVPAPHSIFEGISHVAPGTRVRIDFKTIQSNQPRFLMEPYWSPARVVEDATARRGQMARMSYEDRIHETEQLLTHCVSDRMVADVPLGAFLSGGIDSSLVVALMQRQSQDAIKTYSIGFDEIAFDESPHAAAVARHIGTDHHELQVTSDQARAVIPMIPDLLDEPMSDVSIIPTYLVSRFARHDVTVALSGDGGDEVFGGYHRHVQMPKMVSALQTVPGFMRGWAGAALQSASPLVRNILGARGEQTAGRFDKLAAVLGMNNVPDLYEFLLGGAEPNAITGMKRPHDGYAFRSSSAWPTGLSVAEWTMFADAIHFLPGDILTKVDRASMAVSLETRAPLLDIRLFAHAWALPMSDKISGGQGKKILRDILYRHVPRALVDRPKQGFGVPIGAWMRGPLKDWTADMIHHPVLKDTFGLDPAIIEKIWQDHITGRAPTRDTVWRLCVLSGWGQRWLVP